MTEVVATRVVPLWVEARGVEFSWNSLFTGLDANISLVISQETILPKCDTKYSTTNSLSPGVSGVYSGSPVDVEQT